MKMYLPFGRFVLLFIRMMCVWLLDVSVTTRQMGGVLFNGFYPLDPSVGYHLAIYILLVSFVFDLKGAKWKEDLNKPKVSWWS